MNIALIAHDSKKELMVQFCIAYYGTLSKHKLCATSTTGKLVAEATGLNTIERHLDDANGGIQQIIARITCNEIDVLFFFRDPLSPTDENNRPDDIDILRVCDVHHVPVATNIATGEALIHALERGDFEWREIERNLKI